MFGKKNYFAVIQEKGKTYYYDSLYEGSWKDIVKFLKRNTSGVFKYEDLQMNVNEKNQIYSFSKHIPHGFFSISAEFDLVVGKIENWNDELKRQKLIRDEAMEESKKVNSWLGVEL